MNMTVVVTATIICVTFVTLYVLSMIGGIKK